VSWSDAATNSWDESLSLREEWGVDEANGVMLKAVPDIPLFSPSRLESDIQMTTGSARGFCCEYS
jgi:hypothetical protein